MKKLLLLLLFAPPIVQAQRWQAEIMVGVSGYNGDLSTSAFTPKVWHPAVSINGKYAFNNLLSVRAGIMYGKVSGADRKNADSVLHLRNLAFESRILEGSICAEFNLLSPALFDTYPYIFAGVGFFHFDPYSYDNSNQKVFLRNLGTEGQGLSSYPDRSFYSLTQFCLPFGAGVKSKLNERFDITLEAGFRKLFTDYLDDVSTRYANKELLLTGNGPKAVEMSYRGLHGGNYPDNGKRGNSKKNDWYYLIGIKLTYYIFSADGATSGSRPLLNW